MALEVAEHPLAVAVGHARPRVEALKEVECARGAELAGGIRMACIHNPSAHDMGTYMHGEGGDEGRGRGSAPFAGGPRKRRVCVAFTSRRHICDAGWRAPHGEGAERVVI